MTSGDARNDDRAFIEDVVPEDLIHDEQLRHTPQQHQELKRRLHGSDQFEDIRRSERRYLVTGSGHGPAKDRREVVRQELDSRISATAFMLEDFGFTREEIDLWAPAFDILASMASHVIGVLEDFDGGHVWELGYLYRTQRDIRDNLWLLKRLYEQADTMRENYDNGMAASHMAALERASSGRVVEWTAENDLISAIDQIP